MISHHLNQIWAQLRGQKPSRANSLEEVTIRGLRGIRDLRVALPFPVTVLAGPNGCGKSTVLFALACAYRQPGRMARLYTPASLFPDFRPAQPEIDAGSPSDLREDVELTFSYIAINERLSMRWARGRKGNWNRSFFGKKRGSQPFRPLYLRTLANLSNPSELRSVLQMARKQFNTETVDASNIAFAQHILSYRYSRLSVISSGLRNVLFAERSSDETGGAAQYSEFHMSAGERAVLWLSWNISKLEDAVILIDEVEAGLHPHVQQLLMLELQRLSLRNQLQIIVTTHSPVILDTVPPEARVFLERSPDNVVRREPYRDIIQKALYGQSQDVLSLLCEDEEAEAFLRGVLDHLGPKLDFLQNDIQVGRDTGKQSFPAHLETLGRFKKLRGVVFVLDGDGRSIGPELESRAQKLGQVATVLYLPGNDAPEAWVWERLKGDPVRYAPEFGFAPETFSEKLRQVEDLYANATDRPAAIAKGRLYTLANDMARTTADVLRMVGRLEAVRGLGEVHDLVSQIQDAITRWRTAGL